MLLLAPAYRQAGQPPSLGAVFTYDMICEATIDRIVELLKLTNSGNNPLYYIYARNFTLFIDRYVAANFICL